MYHSTQEKVKIRQIDGLTVLVKIKLKKLKTSKQEHKLG